MEFKKYKLPTLLQEDSQSLSAIKKQSLIKTDGCTHQANEMWPQLLADI